MGPEGEELITRGNRLAAIRSAPWTVRAGTALLLADQVPRAIADPRIVPLILFPFGFVFSAMVLAGIRVIWQVALIFTAGDVVFAYALDNATWDAVLGAVTFVLLLLPSSRRYFQPGRKWLSPSLEGMSYEDWERGGLRHLRLKERLPNYLEPRSVRAFFVACRGGGRLSILSYVFRREYAVAATDEGVVVVRIRRPPIVSARLTGIVAELRADDPQLAWDDETFVVAGRDYRPIRHHEAAADEVAHWLTFRRRNPSGRRPTSRPFLPPCSPPP
ncbi:MAG TPA: hypothetical protein VHO06_11430 [Polyangia bacterium]|nr:hypothetical protein [Polyangia bacterium]